VSPLTSAYQTQGLWIEQDATTAMRYDVGYDGASAFLFSASFSNGSVTVHRNQKIGNTVPIWLGVRRTGTQWTLRYSTNGTFWSDHTSFTRTLHPSRIGPYAGTYGEKTSPAFTMLVDYFANIIGPLPNEDAGPPPTTHLTRTVVGSGTITANPDRPAYTCGETVTLTATPSAGFTFQDWSGDAAGTANPITLAMTADRSVTATFVGGGGGGDLSLVDSNLSATLGRDGMLLQVGYRMTASAAETVTLECVMNGPQSETLTDGDHDLVVTVNAGNAWYHRDFRINLPPNASLGHYNVHWKVRRQNGLVLAHNGHGYLTVADTLPVRVPILMYHYFGPVAYDYYWVLTDEFRRQMAALKAYGYTPMFLQEIMDCRADMRPLPAKPIAITIDDGVANQYTEAFPILREYNIKATSFVITGRMGEIDPPYDALSWSQAQEMHDSGLVDAQSHTVTHPYLSQETSQQVMQELVNSRQDLEQYLQKEVHFISWPYGDYNSNVRFQAWQAGYAGGIGIGVGVEPDYYDKWAPRRVWMGTSVSVDYDPSDPGSFFMMLIGDDVVIPAVSLNSISVLDPTTDQPLDTSKLLADTTIKIRVTATNDGPSADVVASLVIDMDQQPANGVLLDTHATGQDVSLSFSPGNKTVDWVWQIPSSASTGTYYVQASFHDQPYVLGWYYSDWQTIFTLVP
jgi:peptidoglycan/xylan/chitin deacetylase (PgdA/CDA1 family)